MQWYEVLDEAILKVYNFDMKLGCDMLLCNLKVGISDRRTHSKKYALIPAESTRREVHVLKRGFDYFHLHLSPF